MRPVLHAPAVYHDLHTDSWLAGFADGEGHFDITPLRGERFPEGAYQPRFEIQLRADDSQILEELRDAFGGGVRPAPSTRPGQADGLKWAVGSKAGLAALVDYFEAHPLRAKKRHDYEVWRDAVNLYVQEGYRAPGLVALSDQLRALRRP